MSFLSYEDDNPVPSRQFHSRALTWANMFGFAKNEFEARKKKINEYIQIAIRRVPIENRQRYEKLLPSDIIYENETSFKKLLDRYWTDDAELLDELSEIVFNSKKSFDKDNLTEEQKADLQKLKRPSSGFTVSFTLFKRPTYFANFIRNVANGDGNEENDEDPRKNNTNR